MRRDHGIGHDWIFYLSLDLINGMKYSVDN